MLDAAPSMSCNYADFWKEQTAILAALRAADEKATRGVSVDLRTAQLIRGAFLPTNPNKLRSAIPEVIAAAKTFIDALSAELEKEKRAT